MDKELNDENKSLEKDNIKEDIIEQDNTIENTELNKNKQKIRKSMVFFLRY